jgi:hypothetical protein
MLQQQAEKAGTKLFNKEVQTRQSWGMVDSQLRASPATMPSMCCKHTKRHYLVND